MQSKMVIIEAREAWSETGGGCVNLSLSSSGGGRWPSAGGGVWSFSGESSEGGGGFGCEGTARDFPHACFVFQLNVCVPLKVQPNVGSEG